MNSKLIKNNSKKLVIIFQSAGRIPLEKLDEVLCGKENSEEIKKYHENYNWFGFSKNKDADYLFIEDYYNKSYGWYMFENGEIIIDQINKEITEVIEKNGYEYVVTFGSSKGGTAAILYGLINQRIDNVFALVPQINVIKYIEKYMKKYKEILLKNMNEDTMKKIENIFYNKNLYTDIDKKNIYVYTGINDDQFDELIKLKESMIGRNKANIIINISDKKHTKVVIENKKFIESMLLSIINKKRVLEKRLIKIEKNMFLLKDI